MARRKEMLCKRRLWPALCYSVLSLVIVLPLFAGKYVLSLDMVFADNMAAKFASLGTGIRTPLYLLWHLLDHVMPPFAVQKIILFLIPFLSGISMHRLFQYVSGKDGRGSRQGIGAFFAGTLYAVNPFVYYRFMAGHYFILLAYSIFPFYVLEVIRMLRSRAAESGDVMRNLRSSLRPAIVLFMTGILSAHFLFFGILFASVFLCFELVQSLRSGRAQKDVRKRRMVLLAAMIAIVVFLNLYWLVPYALGENDMLSSISDEHAYAFRTSGGIFDVLMMRGFWRDAYVDPGNLPGAGLIALFFLALSAAGYASSRLEHKSVFLLLFAASAFLAVGVSSALTADAFMFLFRHFPFFRAFREPQKFVAFLCLFYSLFAGKGLEIAISRMRKAGKATVIAFSLLSFALVFAYTFTMFGSFFGQLSAVDYPDDWYAAERALSSDGSAETVLVFPWHLYMDFSWNRQRIANPAWIFFSDRVIQGDNMELGSVYSDSTRPESAVAEKIVKGIAQLGQADEDEFRRLSGSILEHLKELGANRIIILKEEDYKDYLALLEVPGISVVMNSTNLYVLSVR